MSSCIFVTRARPRGARRAASERKKVGRGMCSRTRVERTRVWGGRLMVEEKAVVLGEGVALLESEGCARVGGGEGGEFGACEG